MWLNDYDWFFGLSQRALKSGSPTDVDKINRAIAPSFCRTNKPDLDVPEANGDILVDVSADRQEQSLFERLVDALAGEPFELIVRVLQLESDPVMLGQRLDAAECAGFFDSESAVVDGRSGAALPAGTFAAMGPTTKTLRCIDYTGELVDQGKQVVVWCIFKQSMKNIRHLLTQRGVATRVIDGSTSVGDRRRLIEEFKQGRYSVLITNPHTLAESVSLHSVCHDAVYFEYSYNLVHLLQSKDRIHRLGLPAGQYTQYHFLRSVFLRGKGTWSLDQKIYERLRQKERTMLDSIDRGRLEAGYTDGRDIEILLRELNLPAPS